MNNYIILNGTNSDTITGLLIQSLPPISKPQQRVQIEEIDGRDGDVITELGYAAYDKEISIGLYGDYDVDEIIAFFNSSGTVTFSNESDKYYNYQILEQIDFERLIRFKTATVRFHVQPFKYSVSENQKVFNIDNNLLSVTDYTDTSNGLTLTASDGTITVSGTATADTEFYVPITSLSLEEGSYSLYATASGTLASATSIRLIGSVPSDADTFGGTYLSIQNDATVSQTAELTETETYNYVWFYITENTVDYTLSFILENNADNNVSIRNNGNYISKPLITIYGAGDINLSLNSNQIFVINLGNIEYITIDAAQMEAYQNGTLMNRLVTGDYDNFALNVGANTLSWSGDITSIEISNYSRWL